MDGISEVSYHLPVRLACIKCTQQELQIEYTLGHEIHHNPYHIPLIRHQMARNVEALYPNIRNEMITAFDHILDLSGDGEHFSLIYDCHS